MKELKMVADGRDRTKDTRIAMYLEKRSLVFYKESLNKKLGEWEETKWIGNISNGELADDPSEVNYILNMSPLDRSVSIFRGFTDFRKAEEKDFPEEEPKEEKDSQKDGNNKGGKKMEEETNEDLKADINQLNNIENTIKEYKEKAEILNKRIEERRTNRAILAKEAIKKHIYYLGYFGVTNNHHEINNFHRDVWDTIESLIKDFVVLMVKTTTLSNEENRIKFYIERLNKMISKMADEILKS